MPDDPLRLVDVAAAIAAIFVAVVVGVYGFTHRRKVTAQRATLEFIAQYEVHNQEWLELLVFFNSMTSPDRMQRIVTPENDDQRRDAVRLITVLNHYEIVAIAIEHQSIDEDIYKEWFRFPYVQFWEKAEPTVIEWRRQKNSPRAFVRFEHLAKRWKKEILAERT